VREIRIEHHDFVEACRACDSDFLCSLNSEYRRANMYLAFGEILSSSRKRRAFPFAARLMTVLIALINRDLPSHISTAQFPFAIRLRYIRFSRRAPRLGHYPIDKARSCHRIRYNKQRGNPSHNPLITQPCEGNHDFLLRDNSIRETSCFYFLSYIALNTAFEIDHERSASARADYITNELTNNQLP